MRSDRREGNGMWFWWFLLFCDMLVPAVMLVGGRWMWKHPPKTVNGFIGYRTARSMKNADTWHFAQAYCGRLWWKIGWILLVPSVLVLLPFYGAGDTAIGTVGIVVMAVQTAVLLLSVWPTERALKRTFTDGEIRK